MKVYYVVGDVVVGDVTYKQGEEISKFFELAHAATHMAEVAARRTQWTNLHIETREETADEQHHAHGGKVGK